METRWLLRTPILVNYRFPLAPVGTGNTCHVTLLLLESTWQITPELPHRFAYYSTASHP